MKPLFGIALLLAMALVVAGTDARLQTLEKGLPPGHHLLYLPNGRYLKVATLGYSGLAADAIYLWSIQFYGNFQIEDRYKYVDHIYSNVITDLDPHYFDPYWLGALILSVETKDIDKALKLLDKGFANNPEKWIFPYLAGWECAYAHQYERAITYFRKAAAVPSAPPDVARLVAGMYQKEGDKSTALTEWSRIARETTDPSVRKLALNRVHALEIEVDVERIQAAIDRYRAANGSPPSRLRGLVQGGFLDSLPISPDGGEYAYDWRTGTVSAGPPRVIPP